MSSTTQQPAQPAPARDAELIRIGSRMSNVCYNLAQQEGTELGADACNGMKSLSAKWDAAILASKPGGTET